MSSDVKLNEARRKVQSVLKDRMKTYLALMGAWFKGKLTKAEFDTQARDLFTDDTVRVHNEFLLAMLNRCQSVAGALSSKDLNKPPAPIQSPPVLQKQKSVKKPFVKANFTQRFQPANQLRQVRAMVSPPRPATSSMFASSSHGLLPDAGMVEGRLFVAAWEVGLENVQNQVYSYICHATENLLKDVISHVLSCRRGYRVSNTTKVKQYIGLDVPLVYLPPTSTDDSFVYNPIMQVQHQEAETVQSLARAGHMPPSNESITPLDMFTALQSDPGVIGSFTAYTLAMERLSTRLYHSPSTAPNPTTEVTSRKRKLLAIGSSPPD